MSSFIHLHNHSDYSLLDGATSVSSLAKKAKACGMSHLALTDHGNMFGALRFFDACKNEGISPILGCEVYICPESRFLKDKNYKYFHMILLAKNENGYRNLLKLVSIGYKEGFYFRPRIDDEVLAMYKEGLICTAACIGGEIPQFIINGQYEKAKAKAIFYQKMFPPGDFYLEVQRHGIPEEEISNKGLVRISKETGIPLIATNDIHYLEKEHFYAHDILLCIGTAKKLDDPNRFKFSTNEFYFKTPQEMETLFSDIPQAISNTVELAEKCDLSDLHFPGPLFPDYHIPPEFNTSEDYVRHLVKEGLEKRYSEVTEEIKKRAEFELSVIFDMNGESFAGYFLIVWDFIHYARQQGIPVGPGRGSGAGSIVAYAMEITDIDPLKYNLLFERFLNPERVSMPDFDVDFCNEGRNQVIDYVTQKYGKERVGAICTFGTLKTKAALKDVARVLEIPFDEANEISKVVPEGKVELPNGSKVKVNINVALQVTPELQAFYNRGGKYKELFDVAAILENLNRHVSTHACGMVIGKDILTNYVPLFKDPKTKQISTQYTMDLLEDCGLVKIDFLGLKTLTVIKNTENLIHRTQPDFDIEKISYEDPKTFKLLTEGKTEAIFQFESPGMQKILRDARPKDIEEMIALNALYRPGPMEFIPKYVATKNNREKMTFPDPALEEILRPTYGVIVYQEQVMQVAQIIGGFSLGKADILRRAMGKKKAKDMAIMKKEFVKGAAEKGHSEQHAVEIFEMLEPFAGYGFNKSHAAAYSVIAYKTAYLKANYPAEFMAANLTNEINSPDKYAQYLEATKKIGLKVLPPDINHSESSFSVVDGKIYYGLQGIKKVGGTVVESIIQERDINGSFTSFLDFIERVDSRVVNKGILEAFILSGLFDQYSINRATLMQNLEKLVTYATKKREFDNTEQISLFGEEQQDEVLPPPILDEVEEFQLREKLAQEKEYLGFFYSGHPLDPFKTLWKQVTNIDLHKVSEYQPKHSGTILGFIKNIKVFTISKGKSEGKQMGVGDIEDFNGEGKFVLFAFAWEKYAYLIKEAEEKGTPLILKGELSPDRAGSMENPQIAVDSVYHYNNKEALTSTPREGERRPYSGNNQYRKSFAPPAQTAPSSPPAPVKTVHIRLHRENNEGQLFELRNFIVGQEGDSPIFLHLASQEEGKETVIQPNFNAKLKADKEILHTLSQFECVHEAWVE